MLSFGSFGFKNKQQTTNNNTENINFIWFGFRWGKKWCGRGCRLVLERTLLSNSNHCSPAVPPPPTLPHILRFLKAPDAQDGNQYADASGSAPPPHREGPSGVWADGYQQTLITCQERLKERKMRAICWVDGTITRTLGPLGFHHSTHNGEDSSVQENKWTRVEPSRGQWS